MPTYEMQIPSGKTYQIEAPDFETAMRALAGAKPSEASSSPITASNLMQSAADIPIIGPLARKANAAVNAALAPAVDPYLPDSYDKLPEATFGERYTHALGSLEKPLKYFSEQHPVASALANITGTAAATLPLAGTALGSWALGLRPSTLAGQMAAGAASGAGINATDALARGEDVVNGGTIGGIVGGTFPAAARAVGAVAAPVLSNIRARVNPEGYAQSQVARALLESGQTARQVEDAITAAAREGQPVFTAADAMGNAGQRLLSTTARAPGEGRTLVTDFLEGRQADQGRRIANQLAEGFDSPATSQTVATRLENARDAAANIEYGAARNNANPVDLTQAIANIDATLTPGVNQIARPSRLANDSIEAALESFRRRLTDNRSMLTDFTAVQRVRGDLADAVQQAVNRGQGNRARLLGGVLREIDSAMEAASPGFRQANRNFEAASRNMEAVGEGRTAAQRGRYEDTIPAFQALPTEGRMAFRAGYSDPLIESTQGAAFGVNKARPFTSDAFRREASAIAPYAQPMMRRLGREQTMFETRNQALGNSKTAENLADQAAMNVDPTLIAQLLHGNMMGALRTALGSVSDTVGGNTAAVRKAVADILLTRGQAPGRANFQRLLDQTMDRLRTVQMARDRLTRAASAGLAEQANR